jgi:Zn-dependent peptidase ImmA (M78 family)
VTKAELVRRNAGLHDAPIRPESVALHLGIAVQYEAFSDDLSGALIRKEGASVIAVNSGHSKTRQAFTMAHEIGHAALGHAGDIFVDKAFINKRDLTSSMAVNAQEIQANQFAASLLMPKALLMPEFGATSARGGDRDELIKAMAKKFAVSKKAMEYRLVNLAFISPPDDD